MIGVHHCYQTARRSRNFNCGGGQTALPDLLMTLQCGIALRQSAGSTRSACRRCYRRQKIASQPSAPIIIGDKARRVDPFNQCQILALVQR
jgi:hypothetical protein